LRRKQLKNGPKGIFFLKKTNFGTVVLFFGFGFHKTRKPLDTTCCVEWFSFQKSPQYLVFHSGELTRFSSFFTKFRRDYC